MHQGLPLTQQLHPRSCACIHMCINTLTFSKPLALNFTLTGLQFFNRFAMISSDPGRRPGKLEHNVSQPGHRWIYAIFACACLSGKDYECHLTVFASIFYRCVENISFWGHVLALNFGQPNQDEPFTKKTWKSQFLEKLLEEVTMVVKDFLKKSRNNF